MDFPLTFTGNMALGCMMRFNSSIEFLTKMRWRMIFTPPVVEPEQPPMNISKKRITQRKVGQAV